MRGNKKTAIRRYIKDIELHLPEKVVVDEIQSFLKEECFYKTVWRQEDCFCADHWRADDGLGKNLKKLFFFKYEYQAGFLHIEAWIREGKNRERGLSGIIGNDLTTPYLAEIVRLQKSLVEKLPKGGSWYKREKQLLQKEEKKICNSIRLFRWVLTIVGLLLLIGWQLL